MKYVIPASKLVFGTVFLIVFVFAGIASMFEQFNIVGLIVMLVGAFISFKILVSGWRGYKTSIGTYAERSHKARLKAKKFQAEIDIKIAKIKRDAEESQVEFEKRQQLAAEAELEKLSKREIERQSQEDAAKRSWMAYKADVQTASENDEKKQKRQKQASEQFKMDVKECRRYGINVGLLESLKGSLNEKTREALDKARQSEKDDNAAKEKRFKKRIKNAAKEFTGKIDAEILATFERLALSSALADHRTDYSVEVSIGTPRELVGYIWGPEEDVKLSKARGMERATIKYGKAGKNRLGNPTYRLEAVFENDLLKSYKQL